MNFTPVFTEIEQSFVPIFTENEQIFEMGFAENEQIIDLKFEALQIATLFIGGETYSGEYDVIPSTTMQTLETKHKAMGDDVTIQEIPYAEVSNTSGGVTATIG